MSITLINSCIEELQIPPNKARKIDTISGYLYSLKNFMLLIKGKKEKVKNILDKLATLIKLRKAKKNEIILNEGEKGKEFFILLKGKISVLTPKINEYYMSKEEYISYLFQLKLKDQNELIYKTLSLNSNIYSIHEDSFESFIYNLSLGKTLDESYSKYFNLIIKAQKVYQHILEHKKILDSSNSQENQEKIIISPEDYIIQNSVPEEIVENTILIENYLKRLDEESNKNEDLTKENFDDNNENCKKLLNNRKKILIPGHEIFGELESGSYFGEMALEEKGSGKRNATLISSEECYIGTIDKKDYYFLLKQFIEKAHNKYLTFISTFYIFKNLSTIIWEKRYITLFINRVYEKDYFLLKEGKSIDQVFFTYKGEFELTTNKNLLEVNELIIFYKKILRELLNKNKKNSNKEMLRNCDFREEIKENDNFIMNKKFEGEKMKKMVYEKKLIKLRIISSKEIIGLLDLYTSIKYKKTDLNNENNNFRTKAYQMLSLFNCKCISCNCEVYSFPLIKFKDMCNHEDKVCELTNEVEIKKIFLMIERLKHYKNFLFESNYSKENQSKKDIKKIANKNIHKGIRNKFELYKEISNMNLKNKIINLNFAKNKTFKIRSSQRKLSNSYSNYIFSNNKNRNRHSIFNVSSQTKYKILKNNERIKIKQKFLQLPTIVDFAKNNELINKKSITEENQNLNSKNNRYSSESNNSRNSFINVDKLGKSFFSKKPLIKKHNWVSKVLVKNLVYNCLFDKFAFSSFKNSRNDYNYVKDNLKNNLKTSDERKIINIDEYKSKNKPFLIKNEEKSFSMNGINKTESNLFLKKINKSLSSISKENKIKNIKKNSGKKKIQVKDFINENNNRIYDALIYENFNKFFNERVYKQFFED